MFGIAHRSVRASPHFLQFEFLDSSLVGGDGSALDTDRILLDSLGRVDSDLIVGLRHMSERHRTGRCTPKKKRKKTYSISALHSQVVVLEVNIDEGQDKLATWSARVSSRKRQIYNIPPP